MNNKTKIKLTPEIKRQIALAEKYMETAKEIEKLIIDSGAKIDELAVAFSRDIASLGGLTTTAKDKNMAEEAASKHPEVKNISNGVIILKS